MRPQWQRLVACLGLVAFVAANTHAAVAVAAALSPAELRLPSKSAPAKKSAASRHTSCRHCGKSGAAKDAAAVGRGDAPCTDRPNCPDCPHGPSCPCPGGCAACNVAKVPCFSTAPSLALEDACLGASPEAPPSFYSPPSAGRLIRPPRA